jgi:hypothetical protein
MARDVSKSFLGVRLRMNPAYELVLFDRLSRADQQALGGLRHDPESYGVLRPRNDAGLTIKSVSRDTALLLFTLQTPGTLPRYAVEALGERRDSTIGQMVLDGILEIEDGGKMLSGPAAYALFLDDAKPRVDENALAALSRRALEYAEALETSVPTALSRRLYDYNHVPATPRWRRLLPDEAAAELHLGVNGMAAALARTWTRLPDSRSSGWMAWQARRLTLEHAGATTYKLYVSPSCSQLRAAFEATVEAVARSGAFSWKVGNDFAGLLRPDKIVVYFREFTNLQATAADILRKLEGCPAQGVPFTAELSPLGLLSWGIDPPTEEHTVSWLQRESWRLRICNRLGSALALAKASSEAGVSASRFAMERLRLEGIDTDTWAPTATLGWATPG